MKRLIVIFVVLSAVFTYGFFSVSSSGSVSDEVFEESEDIVGVVPYECIFRQYADSIGWDWELLAALCWCESHFNPCAMSQSGALGLMQLMPRTAYRFGLNDSTVFEPVDNIAAGVNYIRFLQRTYSFIGNARENENFVIASYNAGPAHIMDARRLARRYGGNPFVWFGETEYWLERLQEERYWSDSVVLYGSFNARETIAHVKKVRRTSDIIRQGIELPKKKTKDSINAAVAGH